MEILTPLLLAFALSIDGFGVGLVYGIKRVKFALLPIFLVVLCSFIAMTFSISIGQLLKDFIPLHLTHIIGGIILVLIGLWQLIEGWKNYRINKITAENEENSVLLTINIKILGLVLQVMREPVKADMDKSGDISYKEALILGIALNIDAVGAGFGAGIAGFSFSLIPVVSITLFFALLLGLLVGKKFATSKFDEKAYFLPGMILMFLGFINMIK